MTATAIKENTKAAGDVAVGKELLPYVNVADSAAVGERLLRELDKLQGKLGYVSAILEAHRDQTPEVLDAGFDVSLEVRDALGPIVRTAAAALLAKPQTSDVPGWQRSVFAERLQGCITALMRCDMRLCCPENALENYDDDYEARATMKEIADVRQIVGETRGALVAMVAQCTPEADLQRRNMLEYFDGLSDGDKAEIVDVLRKTVSGKHTPTVPSEDGAGDAPDGDQADDDGEQTSEDLQVTLRRLSWRLENIRLELDEIATDGQRFDQFDLAALLGEAEAAKDLVADAIGACDDAVDSEANTPVQQYGIGGEVGRKARAVAKAFQEADDAVRTPKELKRLKIKTLKKEAAKPDSNGKGRVAEPALAGSGSEST